MENLVASSRFALQIFVTLFVIHARAIGIQARTEEEFYRAPGNVTIAVGQAMWLEWNFVQEPHEQFDIIITKDILTHNTNSECVENSVIGFTCLNSTGQIVFTTKSVTKQLDGDYDMILKNSVKLRNIFHIDVIDLHITIMDEDGNSMFQFPSQKPEPVDISEMKIGHLDIPNLSVKVGKEYIYRIDVREVETKSIICSKNVNGVHKSASTRIVPGREIEYSFSILNSEINQDMAVVCNIIFESSAFKIQQKVLLESDQNELPETSSKQECSLNMQIGIIVILVLLVLAIVVFVLFKYMYQPWKKVLNNKKRHIPDKKSSMAKGQNAGLETEKQEIHGDAKNQKTMSETSFGHDESLLAERGNSECAAQEQETRGNSRRQRTTSETSYKELL